jgi:hypothetical protein
MSSNVEVIVLSGPELGLISIAVKTHILVFMGYDTGKWTQGGLEEHTAYIGGMRQRS